MDGWTASLLNNRPLILLHEDVATLQRLHFIAHELIFSFAGACMCYVVILTTSVI